MESYRRLGFGMYRTELKEGGTPIGICGLVQRASLKDVDIGFALFPQFWGKGYAQEAASAVLAFGRSVLGLRRIVAVTTHDNHDSISVLEKLGMRFEKMVRLSEDDVEICLFSNDA
jgi:RimJ/RimL family protein N-acetyltransferase